MSRALTIARRELRGYFDQPIAYVLIVAFLAITLFLAFRTMYAMSVASLRPIFDLLPVLFAVFVPAATMRPPLVCQNGRPRNPRTDFSRTSSLKMAVLPTPVGPTMRTLLGLRPVKSNNRRWISASRS